MKNIETKNIRFFGRRMITYICLLLVSCNFDNTEGKRTSNYEDRTDNSTMISEVHSAKKSSGSFKEFVMRQSEIKLHIYSPRVDEAFDLEEAIELNVELFSPRFITYKTYQNTIGANQPKPQIDDFQIGSNEKPWQENLSLFYLSGDKEIPLSYAIKHPSDQNTLNIGKGDIGSVGIILQPGFSISEGKLQLRLKYFEPEKDIELIAETSITLKKDQVDEQQIQISNIYYLIAIDEMEEALKLSIKSVQSWPESYHANVLLGEIYEENGQLEEALIAYRKGIVRFKNDQEDRIIEFPKGLWDKINELEEKLK